MKEKKENQPLESKNISQETLVSNQKTNEETKVKTADKPKKKTRFFIVLFFAIIAIIIAYILFRGTYLETLELGENYIQSFWQNVRYKSTTLFINFIVIYGLVCLL